MATSLVGKRISEQYTELLIRDTATKKLYDGAGGNLYCYVSSGTGNFDFKFGQNAGAGNVVDTEGTIAIGRYAGYAATSFVVAIGNNAGRYSTGSRNVAYGGGALAGGSAASGGSTSSRCVAVGTNALGSVTTGDDNVGVGGYVAELATSLSQTTAIGGSAGRSLTGVNCVVIGHSAAYNAATLTNCVGVGGAVFNSSPSTITGSTAIGASAQVTGNNQVQLGATGTTTYAFGAVQDRSDIRDKADVRDTVLGLDFVMQLRPVDFRWDMRDFYVDAETPGSTIETVAPDGSKKRARYHHGLIAQEVAAVIADTGVDFGGFQDHSLTGGFDVKSLGYTELIGPMIKAIQELKAEFEAYKVAHP